MIVSGAIIAESPGTATMFPGAAVVERMQPALYGLAGIGAGLSASEIPSSTDFFLFRWSFGLAYPGFGRRESAMSNIGFYNGLFGIAIGTLGILTWCGVIKVEWHNNSRLISADTARKVVLGGGIAGIVLGALRIFLATAFGY